MEKHNLGDQLFHLVNQYLQENGLKVARGTIVDASIISAPSSTKNQKKERDPEMHQTRTQPAKTIADMGIAKDQSSKWQRLAGAPALMAFMMAKEIIIL